MARREKKVRWEKSGSPLQTVFVRRLIEILKDRGMSDNQLAGLIRKDDPGAIQRSISRITACIQDPTLEKVHQIAQALGVQVADLVKDYDEEMVRIRTETRGPLFSTQNKVKRSVNTAVRNRSDKR
jgi:transcriptional regulator with XRE-family HTH domain